MYYTPYDNGNVNDTTDLSYTNFAENTPTNIHRDAHLPYNGQVQEESMSHTTPFRSSSEPYFSRAISRPYSSDISEPVSGNEQLPYISPSKPYSTNLAASWSYSADAANQMKVPGVNNMQPITGSLSSLDTFPPPPPPPIAPVYRLSSTLPSTNNITSSSGGRIDDTSSSPSYLFDSSQQQDIYTDIPDTSQIDEKMEEYKDVFTYRILLNRDDPIGPCCICYSSDLISPLMISSPLLLQQQQQSQQQQQQQLSSSCTPTTSPSASPPPLQPQSSITSNTSTSSSFRKSIENNNNDNNNNNYNSPSSSPSAAAAANNNNNNNLDPSNNSSISPVNHDNNQSPINTSNSNNNNININNYWIILTCVQYHCSHSVHAMCLLHSNYSTLHLSHLPVIQPYPRIIPQSPLYNNPNPDNIPSKIQMTMSIDNSISSNKYYASHFYLPVIIKENRLLNCSIRSEEFKIRPAFFPFSQINFGIEIYNDIGALYYRWNWVLQFDPHSPLMCFLLLDHETGNRITLYVKPSAQQPPQLVSAPPSQPPVTPFQGYEICEFQLDFSPYETWLYYPLLNNPNTIPNPLTANGITAAAGGGLINNNNNILPPPPPPAVSPTPLQNSTNSSTSSINIINTQGTPLVGLTPQQQQQQQQSLLLSQSHPPLIPPQTQTAGSSLPLSSANTSCSNVSGASGGSGYVNSYTDLTYTSPYSSLYISPNDMTDAMLIDPLQQLNSSNSSIQSIHSTPGRGGDDNNNGNNNNQSMKKKGNRNRNNDNGEIPTNLLELGCSQSGSKRLQDLITNGDSETVAKLCNETLPYIFDLSTNMFGNYFIQKLFIASNDELKCNLLNSLKPRMAQLACHKMGTYPFQNIIKDLKTDQHAEIIAEGLMMDINSVLTNHFGVHVLQKFQHQFSHKAQQWLFDYINEHIKEVATNQQGIVVLKGCIEVGSIEQRQETIGHILKYCKEFSVDEYGNYAIQSMIDHADDKIKVINEIYKNLKGDIASLCKNKFSSNVIEKCLSCESDTRKAIINEILSSPDFNSILADKYGNYVIQYLITIVDSTQKPILAKKIKSYLPKIEKEEQQNGRIIYLL